MVFKDKCFHMWEYTEAEPVTLFPTKRKCKKCGKIQLSEIVWKDEKKFFGHRS